MSLVIARHGSVSLRMALLAGTAFMAHPAVAQDQGGRPTGVEEIVVTAQKREQNMQRVPISITVMSENFIKANRIENVRDLSALAPNLTVRFSGGGAQLPNYTLRGILTNGAALGTDKGVGLYVDGVYIQNVVGSVLDFADIARIEVLKGPQGTLFGRNVTGGAISITTRDPTGVFGAKQELTYGNYDQFRSKTHVDLPQFGPLSVSVNYLHSERRGDIKNLGAGSQINYVPATGGALGMFKSPKYLGSNNTEAVGVAAKLDIASNLDVSYKFDYAKNNYTPNGQGLAYLTPVGLGPTPLLSFYNGSPNPKTPVSSKRPKEVNNSFSFPGYTYSYGHNLTAKYRLNDEISFKNILASRKAYTQAFFQLDGMGGLVAPISPTTGNLQFNPTQPFVIAPLAGLVNTTRDKTKQWSNEFQINIDTDWFNLTTGYLHFHSSQETEGFANTVNVPAFTPYGGQLTSAAGTPGVAPGNPGYRLARVSVNSDAWFVQPEFHVTPQIDMAAGARITIDRKNGVEPFPRPSIAAARPDLYADSIIAYRDTEATYMAQITYRPVDNILTYGKYSTGYISGGVLATIQFEPERASSFEAGVKADLFDRRFRSNLAVFDVKYKSIQYNTAGSLAATVPCSPQFTIGDQPVCAYGQATIASGDARAKGFEWENTFIPVNGLTLTANLGYTDFKFDDSTIFPGFVIQSGAPGYRPFARPKWTGQIAGQYESQAIFMGGHLFLRADANFKSKELLTSNLTTASTGITAPLNPAYTAAATAPFSWIVNGRVALTDMSLGRTKAEVAVWSRNLFNNRNITQFVGVQSLGFASAIYEPARTFGLDVSLTF